MFQILVFLRTFDINIHVNFCNRLTEGKVARGYTYACVVSPRVIYIFVLEKLGERWCHVVPGCLSPGCMSVRSSCQSRYVERRKRALAILVFVAVNVSKRNGVFYLVCSICPFMAGRESTRPLSPAFPSAILAINRCYYNVWRKYISSIRGTNAINESWGWSGGGR